MSLFWCENCKRSFESNSDESGICSCGIDSRQKTYGTLNVVIPRSFKLSSRNDDYHLPTTAEEKRIWKENAGIDVDKVSVHIDARQALKSDDHTRKAE